MSMNIAYQGEKRSASENEKTRTVTYNGSKAELQTYMESLTVGSRDDSGDYITNVVLSQKAGDIWQLEITYTNSTDENSNDKPLATYGKKSAQLTCGLLSLPIEGHKNYRMNWNNYLIAKGSSATTPDWWSSDTYSSRSCDNVNYKWVKDIEGMDSNWKVLEEPTKPGVETYDIATYQITESIKCKSSRSAGNYVANIINTICAPENSLGIRGGNWKCDNGTVSYNGSAWIATMTYTRSGDNDGWDKDLYE